MSKFLTLGQIVKPQGIKGEVKVLPNVDKISGFKTLKSVYVDGEKKEIAGVRADGSGVFLLFSGIHDRDSAEKLRNKEVSVPLEEAEAFREGYFIIELKGLKVFVDERETGILTEVLHTGSVDVFVVDGKRKYMVPFLKRLVLNVDLQKGIIKLEPKIFEEGEREREYVQKRK